MTLFTLTLRDFEKQIEVIVIDDASKNIVKLQNGYPFAVKFENNKNNTGAPFSRERGFHLSEAPFVHFHDSDDSITENWLKEIIDALDKSQNADILLTARIDVDRNKKEYKFQKFFDRNCNNNVKISKRLIY